MGVPDSDLNGPDYLTMYRGDFVYCVFVTNERSSTRREFSSARQNYALLPFL